MIEAVMALATAPFVLFIGFLAMAAIVIDLLDRYGFFGRKS